MTFPELARQHGSVLHILDFEEDNALRLAEKSARYAAKLAVDFPHEARHIEQHEAIGFYDSLKCVQAEAADGCLDTRLAYRLFEGHGLSPADIGRLAAICGLSFDATAFAGHCEDRQRQSKAATALQYELSRPGGLTLEDIPETRDEFKYEYTRTPAGECLVAKKLSMLSIHLRQCCGSKYIEFGS